MLGSSGRGEVRSAEDWNLNFKSKNQSVISLCSPRGREGREIREEKVVTGGREVVDGTWRQLDHFQIHKESSGHFCILYLCLEEGALGEGGLEGGDQVGHCHRDALLDRGGWLEHQASHHVQ